MPPLWIQLYRLSLGSCRHGHSIHQSSGRCYWLLMVNVHTSISQYPIGQDSRNGLLTQEFDKHPTAGEVELIQSGLQPAVELQTPVIII